MEGIIFWLVPVLLLIVFTLVLVQHSQSSKKRSLLLIEPLGTLFNTWTVARFIGSNEEISRLLALAKQAENSSPSPLKTILANLENTKNVRGNLLNEKLSQLWGAQKIIEQEGRIISLLVGDLKEVLPSLKYDQGGKQLISEDRLKELRQTGETAARHGYLPLLIAYRHVHGRNIAETKQHTLSGMVLLEPEIDKTALKKLQALRRAETKLVSVLPVGLLEWLMVKIRQSEQFEGVGTYRPKTPQEQEEYWLSAKCLGSVALRERYSLIRFLQHSYQCHLLSGNVADEQLPVKARLAI